MWKEKITTILYIGVTMVFLTGMFTYKDNQPIDDFLKEYRDTIPVSTPILERVMGAIDAAEIIMIRDTFRREDMNELFGLTQKILGKRILQDPAYGEIYKTEFNQIIYHVEEKDVGPAITNTLALQRELKKEGIPLLYVQAPFKVEGKNSGLPKNVKDYADLNADAFLQGLKEADVDYLDLRPLLRDGARTQNELFFDTDHHWRIETAFDATWMIARHLNEKYQFHVPAFYMDATSYERKVYSHFFIGSMGRRTGFRYGGADDFTYIFPKFETDLTVEQIDGQVHSVTRGAFENSMIIKENLDPEKPLDTNRYAVYRGDNAELIFQNHLITGGKLLIIKDSFALPVYSFLSTSMEEVRALDMRFYQGNVAEYAAQYQPDVTIILYNGDCFNDEMFDFNLEKRK